MSKNFDTYLAASRALNAEVEHDRLPIATSGPGWKVSPVTYKQAPPLEALVASTGQRITPGEIAGWWGRLSPRLDGIAAAGIATNHPCIFYYSDNDQQAFVLQVGYPVPHIPDPVPGGLTVRRDPAGPCASVVLVGDFLKHIGEAWRAANAQVTADGLQRSGEDREIYHHMTGFICTEVQIGLRDTPALAARIDDPGR
jgi:hypothetical protein